MPRPADPALSASETAQDMLATSSLHGVSRLFLRTDALSKFFWFLVSLVSYTSCIVLVAQCIAEFCDLSVVLTSRTNYEAQPAFPSVKICNVDPTRIVQCRFNNASCTVAFTNRIDNTNDKADCVFFNVDFNSLVRSLEPGSQSGLVLGVNRKQGSIEVGSADLNKMEIFVYEPMSEPNAHKAVRAAPGMETSVVVKRRRIERMGAPYSTCQKTGYVFRLGANDVIKKESYPYRQSNCWLTCRDKKYMEACGKSREFADYMQYFYTNYDKYALFIKTEMAYCLLTRPTVIASLDDLFASSGEYQVCSDTCPIECESTMYDVRPHSVGSFAQYAIIHVYYEDFFLETAREEAKMSGLVLLGTVGGIVALFTGASLLSAVEVVELLVVMLCCCGSCQKKKKVTRVQVSEAREKAWEIPMPKK